MISRRISSAERSTWYAVSLTITVAVVVVNLLSIILFAKNSNLRTRAMYLVVNLTVTDMFVGGSATFFVVFHFVLHGCEVGNLFFIFIVEREYRWPPILLVLAMTEVWLSLTSSTGISLDQMHATFRPFRHRNIKTWVYGVAIAGVWILTAMIVIPLPLIRLYLNVQQQWQLLYFVYLLRSYCFLCLVVICVSYTSIALKFWCGTRPPSDGAANRQRKLTVTLFIMTIVSLLLWLPYVVYTFVSFFVLDRFSIRTYLRFYTTQTRLLIPLFTQSEEFRRALLVLFKRRQRQNVVIPLHAR